MLNVGQKWKARDTEAKNTRIVIFKEIELLCGLIGMIKVDLEEMEHALHGTIPLSQHANTLLRQILNDEVIALLFLLH